MDKRPTGRFFFCQPRLLAAVALSDKEAHTRVVGRTPKEAIVLAECVVAGIARTSDPAQLEKILMGCANLDPARLTVITRQESPAQDSSPLRFVHSENSSMGTGSGGTGVPGMSRGATLSSLVGRTSVPHYLSATKINPDLAENYNVAIHEGRSVVVFHSSSGEDPTAVQETFRNCGLVNVRALANRTTKTPA